jgi:hypothetical protein
MTHWVDYSPRNLGRDHVVTVCGRLVNVSDFSPHPTCPACQPAARERAKQLRREQLERVRRALRAVS